MSSQQRTVLVTGGGSGIGRATASAFVEKGDEVVILGRTVEKLEETVNELGSGTTFVQVDVGKRLEVEDAVSEVIERHEQIDVLVNNAGTGGGATTENELNTAEETWNRVLRTNLTGSFLMSVSCAPHMPRPGGRIINISSIAAHTGGSNPGALAYAASKAGLHGLTFSLARELSPHGITANVIAPGFIANTEFSEGWSMDRVQGIIDETPVGRGGHPEDISAAATYLASEAASFVTGEVHNVNGGWLFGR